MYMFLRDVKVLYVHVLRDVKVTIFTHKMLIKLRLGMTDTSTNEPNETTARSMGDTNYCWPKTEFQHTIHT
jgi:hypothetical protein